MRASENVVLKTRFKDVFISRKCYVPHLRYSVFNIFNQSIDFESCNFMNFSNMRFLKIFSET